MLNKFLLRFIEFFIRKNEFESKVLRSFYKKKYGLEIGMYSYGCFDLKRIPQNTVIGRYCSFSKTSQIFSRNHGVYYLSLHPYLYNRQLGFFEGEDRVKETKCIIEDDVWFGHNTIVIPSVRYIGRGAVIAAGAVVTKDVPRYAIVAGNPAKIIKYRFEIETIAKIESTKWWLMDKNDLKSFVESNNDFVYNPKGSDFAKKQQ